jgi:hypothetical protein
MPELLNSGVRACLTVMGLFIIAGCSGPATIQPEKLPAIKPNFLGDGTWVGPVFMAGVDSDGSNLGKDGTPIVFPLTYMLVVCDSKATFWIKTDSGRFSAPSGKFEDFSQYSNGEVHIVYSQHHDLDTPASPAWFETQVMLLTELNADELRAQVSRAVTNPSLANSERYRNFARNGMGTLKRTAKQCPRELLGTAVKD